MDQITCKFRQTLESPCETLTYIYIYESPIAPATMLQAFVRSLATLCASVTGVLELGPIANFQVVLATMHTGFLRVATK